MFQRYDLAVGTRGGRVISAAVVIQDSFLASAYQMQKEITKKVSEALRNLLKDPRSGGLRIQKRSGRASHMWSARVDDDYRLIFERFVTGTPVGVYVAKHEDAYQLAEAGMKLNLGPANLALVAGS